MAQRIDKLNVQGNIVIGKNGYQDSTDKVQMHSSSTESILHITTSSTGSATSDGLRLGVVGSSAYFLLRENANMLFHTNNTERVRIDNTGNVGIGISSPAYRLDVSGSSRIDGHIYTTGNLQSTTADPFPLLRGFTSSPNPENGIGSSYNVGLDENFFAGADLNYTITATQNGSPISVGSNVFRATSSYWSLSVATNDTVVITITGFSFTHTCDFGLSFSTDGWRAKDITIERTTDGGTTWTLVDSVSNYSYNTYKVYSNTGSTATDGIRYTLTNFNTTAIRLSNIFASRYTGGSSYFLERYGDGTLFGKLTTSFKGSVYGLKLERSDAAGSSLMEFANSSGVQNIIGYDAGVDAFKIGTSTATNLVLKGNGRLGIGTTAPDATLHVESTGVTAGGYKYHMIVDDNNAYGINEGGGIIFRGDYNSATAKANFGAIRAGKANANDGNANAYLSLMYGASGTLAEGFRLNWDGKVGIGTTSPAYKLHIDGGTIGSNIDTTGSNTSRQINLTSANTVGMGAFTNYSSNTDVTADFFGKYGYTFNGGTSSASKQFQVYVSDAVNPRIVVNGSGNVGIGTTSPDQKLHVSGNVKATSSRMNYLAKDLTIEGTPQGGTNKGYVLLAKAYTTGFVDASYAIGKVYLRRGTVGTGHNLDVYEVLSSTGYNGDRFIVNLIEGNATRFSQLCKVTYGGVVYHAIETVSSGGEPSTEASFVGIAYDAKLLMTDETFVSSVTAYGTTGTWLDTSGNLGVGTTNPNAKLHVTDSIQVDGGDTFGVDNAGHQIYMSSGGTGLGGEFGSGYARNLIRSDGAATIHIGDNTSLISQIKLDAGSSGTNGYITFLTKQAERMRINENGNVGIGTTSPGDKLTVVGNVNANGSVLGDGNLFLRSYNTDPKGIFFRDGFEYGDTNQYNLSITCYDDGDGAADGMMISAYDGVFFNVQSGATPNTKFRILNNEVKAFANLISTGVVYADGGNSTEWNTAYDNHISGIAVTGTTTKTITLTQKDGGTITADFTDNNTWTALAGATASTAGTAGYAPQPAAGDQGKFLRGDGTWADAPDNSTNVTLVTTNAEYLSLSGQAITLNKVKLTELNGGGTAGLLKTSAAGVVTVDTNTYALSTHTHSYDNYGEWYISGDADSTDVTSGKWVKFVGAASITGAGTEASPYLIDLSGSYASSSHSHTLSDITDAGTAAAAATTDFAAASHTHTFASLTSKPTTLSGYGITDAVYTPDVYEISNQSVTGFPYFFQYSTTKVMEGSTDTALNGAGDGITVNEAGVYEVKYSVAMENPDSTRKNPAIRAELNSAIIKGSRGITYLRLPGANQSPYGSIEVSFYMDVRASDVGTDLKLKMTLLNGTAGSVILFGYHATANTLSIRRIS